MKEGTVVQERQIIDLREGREQKRTEEKSKMQNGRTFGPLTRSFQFSMRDFSSSLTALLFSVL
jgi:hypothetical protein